MKTQSLIIRLDSTLKNKLQKKAEELSLSLSSFVRMTLTEKFKDDE